MQIYILELVYTLHVVISGRGWLYYVLTAFVQAVNTNYFALMLTDPDQLYINL